LKKKAYSSAIPATTRQISTRNNFIGALGQFKSKDKEVREKKKGGKKKKKEKKKRRKKERKQEQGST
jgi:hypothetical protein